MKENKIKLVLKFAVLLVVSLFTAFPFIWMILSADRKSVCRERVSSPV